MVAAPNERIGALVVESARQRFNVAASRAQDQLWLFHSATLDVLSPACMRHRLLSYIINPGRRPDESDQIFESQFERHVFDLISGRGFHVRTQVCIGDPTNHRYRIDLVVEGMEGRLAVECDGDHWHGPDRYEQDMARQRDLERAGWQFVRIRGGIFYRDRAKSMEPLWGELERLGIRPGGINKDASEPPPPANSLRTQREEVDEAIRVESSGENISGEPNLGGIAPPPPDTDDELFREGDVPEPASTSQPCNSLFTAYAAYNGSACGDDPRTVSTGAVAEGLCRIVEVEGPMLAKRAYDIYLRGCGIKRMGGELKSAMNKALASAIRQGRVISEDEKGKGGLLFSVVRMKGSPPVKVRRRGPRTFDEIPPSELLAVGRCVSERQHIEAGTDEHLRAILECFDLKRLTTQVGTTLLEILDRRYAYVDDLFADTDA
jgi:very-short-patch-repair endonuclease